uniref:Uncharacterized protein n=1 Tax=Chenopodium quinoa TaxID=63459 RepID=A0A803MQC4_CHEQI
MEFIAKGWSAMKEVDRVMDYCELYDRRLFPLLRNDYVQSSQQAFYYLEKAAEQLHPGALYLLGAVYLSGDCVRQDMGSAMWCFHRAAEKGNAGAAVAYGSLLLRGHTVLESTTKFNLKKRKAGKTNSVNSKVDSIELAKEQFQIAANTGCDLGLKWLSRIEEEEKNLLSEQ